MLHDGQAFTDYITCPLPLMSFFLFKNENELVELRKLILQTATTLCAAAGPAAEL